eukprot:9418799-Pyramimonas_sp.AAC.1
MYTCREKRRGQEEAVSRQRARGIWRLESPRWVFSAEELEEGAALLQRTCAWTARLSAEAAKGLLTRVKLKKYNSSELIAAKGCVLEGLVVLLKGRAQVKSPTSVEPELTRLGHELTRLGPELTCLGPESTRLGPESIRLGP